MKSLFLIASLACVFATPAALADEWGKGFGLAPPFTFDKKEYPERPSPAVVDIDAGFLRKLSGTGVRHVKEIPHFHCNGAVLTDVELISWTGGVSNEHFLFQFHVGLRRGEDRDFSLTFELLDGDRVVGSGEIKKQNLDERVVTAFLGSSMKVAKADYAKLIAENGKPILRVTMTVDEQP